VVSVPDTKNSVDLGDTRLQTGDARRTLGPRLRRPAATTARSSMFFAALGTPPSPYATKLRTSAATLAMTSSQRKVSVAA